MKRFQASSRLVVEVSVPSEAEARSVFDEVRNMVDDAIVDVDFAFVEVTDDIVVEELSEEV